MPIAKISPMGESGLYHVHFLDATDPGFGGGRPGGVDPGWGQGHPGGHPGNRPPGSGAIPDNDLPDHPPPTLAPGYTIVMVRGPAGKWEYAFIAPGDPPPKPLPNPPEHVGGRPPGQGLPPHVGGGPIMPQPPHVGGGPMPAPPNRPDNTLPPAAQPR